MCEMEDVGRVERVRVRRYVGDRARKWGGTAWCWLS